MCECLYVVGVGLLVCGAHDCVQRYCEHLTKVGGGSCWCCADGAPSVFMLLAVVVLPWQVGPAFQFPFRKVFDVSVDNLFFCNVLYYFVCFLCRVNGSVVKLL